METYFDEFYDGSGDVDEVEMKKSDFKDKYLHGACVRKTRVLNLDVTLSETLSETSSESFSTISSESES